MLGLSPARAVLPDEVMSDPAKEARARDLSRELRCMVCQNQSIDDSEAPLARDLRLLVRERIAAGDSDSQVIDFLVARYGEFVLLKPRFERQTLALWLVPPLVLFGGGLALWWHVRRRAKAGPEAAERLTSADPRRRSAAGGPAWPPIRQPEEDDRLLVLFHGGVPARSCLRDGRKNIAQSQWLRPAINCRIRSRLHYQTLTPPPARCKAAAPILPANGFTRDSAALAPRFSGFGDNLMTDRPIDLSSLPSYRQPRRSLLSARKLALMASVVAGLGIAVYGFSPSSGPVNMFTTPAHAQVANEVRKVQQPVGFADIVERVKPSVISVKVNLNEKIAKGDDNNDDDSPFQPGSPMERFFRKFGGPDGLPPGMRGRRGGNRVDHGAGFRLLHFRRRLCRHQQSRRRRRRARSKSRPMTARPTPPR